MNRHVIFISFLVLNTLVVFILTQLGHMSLKGEPPSSLIFLALTQYFIPSTLKASLSIISSLLVQRLFL